MTATAAPADRVRALDVLRAVAALAVVAGHAVALGGGSVPIVVDSPADALLSLSTTGVWLFFAVSGYVIGRPFVRALLVDGTVPALGPYAVRRAARIYPLYWVALVAAVALAGTAGAGPVDLAAHLGLLHNLVPGRQQAILTVTWTLTLEVLFYAAVALGAVVLARRRTRVAVRTLVAAVLGVWALSTVWTVGAGLVGDLERGLWLRQLFPAMASMFCPGLLVAVLDAAPAGSPWRRPLDALAAGAGRGHALAAAAALVGAGIATALLDPSIGPRRYLVLFDLGRLGFAAGYGLLVALAVTARPATGAAWRALGRLGDWSYGIYLAHAVWLLALLGPLDGLVPVAREGVGPWVVHVAVLLALTVPVAAVLHRLVELPATRVAATWLAARRHRPPAATT